MQKRGFTLVEILAVVLIIGILTAVALPQYRDITDRAKIQNTLIRLRTILDASERLAAENGYRNFVSFAAAKQTEYQGRYSKNYPFFERMGIFYDDEFKNCNKLNANISLKCGNEMFTLPMGTNNKSPEPYVMMYRNDKLTIKLYRTNPPQLTCGSMDSSSGDGMGKQCAKYGLSD